MDRPLSQQTLTKKKYRSWLAALVALIVLAMLIHLARSLITPSLKRSQLLTATVETGSVKAGINATGVVIPRFEETLNSEIDSQIVKLLAQPGQSVSKGDPLMQLEKRGVQLAIDKLTEQVSLKENQIEAKRLGLGQTLNDIDSRLALLDVDLQSREAYTKRLMQLKERGASSAHDLLEAKLNVKRTRIEIDQLKQSKKDHQSTVNAEIAALRVEMSILQKELQDQRRLLAETLITAPKDGVLSWIKNEEGASIAKREPIARLADESSFRVKASLSDFYASRIRPGMEAEVIYNNEVYSGQLINSAPTIEKGVMSVFIELKDATSVNLRNNLRVDVRLITDIKSNVPTVAKGPFANGSGTQTIFVVEDGIAHKRTVKLGLSGRDHYQVVEGVMPGEEVIISDLRDYQHLERISIN